MNITATEKFSTIKKPSWCPGCGDFSIWHGLKKALADSGLEPHQLTIVYDIGCSGNMCSFVNAYGFHGLHGRSIPAAVGVHLSRPELPTIVVGGDGGLFGEGLSHFIHACRANYNLTVIAHDNQVYGLTTGQTSPTTFKGVETKSNPHGGYDEPVDPVSLALLSGATFVAQGFSGELDQISDLIRKGLEHKGFSFIHIYQPCVTFNHINTYEYFRERVFQLERTEQDPLAVLPLLKDKDRIPLGVLYEESSRQDFREQISHLKGVNLVEPVTKERDISNLLGMFQ